MKYTIYIEQQLFQTTRRVPSARMGDEKPPPVLGSAAYPIPRPGMGRARGRARAMPLTQGKEGA